MAATKGKVGYDTRISVKTSKTTGFIPMGEPKDFSGPQITQQFADFTHMQSPFGYQEQKPTYKSSGQITFNVNRVPGDPGQEALIEATNANPTELCDFEVEFPDGSEFAFQAYPGLSFTSPMSGPIEMAVTLTVTGPVTMDNGIVDP